MGVFPEQPRMALAVFTAESRLNPRSQGWNCMYGDVSRSCDVPDRGRAWSVDCGIAQINFPGLKECPEYSYDVDYSLSRARGKYDGRGNWTAWSVYNNGRYLSYLR